MSIEWLVQEEVEQSGWASRGWGYRAKGEILHAVKSETGSKVRKRRIIRRGGPCGWSALHDLWTLNRSRLGSTRPSGRAYGRTAR